MQIDKSLPFGRLFIIVYKMRLEITDTNHYDIDNGSHPTADNGSHPTADGGLMTSTTDYVMMLNLQLFADGGGASAGASGDGGASGTAPATAGANTSTDAFDGLGIPDRIKAKYKDSLSRVAPDKTKRTVSTETDTDTQIKTPDPQERKSFAELVESADPNEVKAYFDKTFSKRFSKYKGIEAENKQMREIIEANNLRYGLDPSSSTYLADMKSAVENDKKLYEDEALEAGLPVEEYLKVKQAERVIAQSKIDEQKRLEEQKANEHFGRLNTQALELKAKIPNFDLNTEMQNEQFRRFVAPFEFGGSNLSVENAFYLIHRNEINQAMVNSAASQAAINTANAVKANKSRPSENGTSATTMATTTKLDPSSLKLDDFRKIQERYRRTGEKPIF